MQSASCLFLISLLICGTFAQKTSYQPIIPIVQKGTPSTPPKPIDESDHRKACPSGFTFVGKQCAKTLHALPQEICPQGTVQANGRCAKYVSKITECPVGYVSSKGACSKEKTAPADVTCPAGWLLSGKDTCTLKVALPEITMCPAGSATKGDGCVRPTYEAPEWTCPSGYTLSGRKCQREETFDCTPARVAVEPTKAEEHSKPALRTTQSKGKGPTHYQLPPITADVEEYVIQTTCKRIVTEPARPVCSHGTFDGKVCVSDVPVQPITKPGGYRDETLPAVSTCPDGYAPSGSKGECVATELVLPDAFCPSGTYDEGHRCATYQQPKTVCPDGFYLEGTMCTKTIFAAPIIEYTVTYTCTGKDCGGH